MSHYCLDANIFTTPWGQSHPPSIFPTLWREICKHKDKFIILKNIYDQIDPPNSKIKELKDRKQKYPLRTWLEENKITPVPVSNEIQKLSLYLEKKYKIRASYITKGADQNDITLIAYAKKNQKTVVTLENPQPNLPKNLSHYKIPLICDKEDVEWMNYIDLLKKLKISV